MNTAQFLSAQFNSTYSEAHWFAPLKNIIQGMNGKEACWKPNSSDHSVCDIVTHLSYWNARLLKLWKGEKLEKMEIDNSQTFVTDEIISDETWQKTCSRFILIMDEFASEIGKASEERLQSKVSPNSKSTWAQYFMHTALHNAYHAGQIVTLRKAGQFWNAEKYGVQ